MIDYGRQKSTVKPEEIEITEDMVFIASGISEITEEGTDSQPGFAGYEFELVGYDKDEYIKLQAEKMQVLKMKLHRHRWQCVKFMKC